jgi:hypothetical protein
VDGEEARREGRAEAIVSDPADIEAECLRCHGSGRVLVTEAALRRRAWRDRQRDIGPELDQSSLKAPANRRTPPFDTA